MKPDELERLRQHYDHTDLSGSIDRARLDTDVDPNPMVTTSLRLPKDVLDWVREQADAQHAKPTALIRQWIEERRSQTRDLEARLSRLEQAVFDQAAH
ncbi:MULTISPECIES: hypothetical protein [Pseudonocardia]|uniref:CopG family transcriptional regulator n=2 Tax=Pseudonocardia TaxID=1847 RepID=A0A1Y2MGU8_PSEAH|nr:MULTISPECIES: hypothetical protein [Pseudonocardia]OSY34514.1 hypothetical protein BG845_06789 [Pseudonocardia autotrophica]TDN65681.1 hypothetical protein C8E95_7194 [Pseudonocardia autotrophica]BBG05832.1 hypothetical protein Pdca_70410 [Pseudonocardia autotrophica]GEC29641.1 hypothetical protein PSA01_66700 [Pseudonocardia saturnea]